MSARIIIPAQAAYFEGHFPERPLVAGVVLLMLAGQETRRQTGQTVRGISFARFRQLVRPGDELSFGASQREEGKARFELTRETVAVVNGEFLLGPFDAAPRVQVAPDCPEAANANLDALLPQRPPMRFVTCVLDERPDGLACGACIPSGCGLAPAGEAPSLVALEAAAQTAAVWEASRRTREGGVSGPRVGYVVSIRDVMFFTEHIAADEHFVAEVRLVQVALPMTGYEVQATVGNAIVLRGRIATFLTEESLPASAT
jgi:3-hydroxymyristoyl/3-hydroxydecanoyl-(acyl carrier protein) dehydratase